MICAEATVISLTLKGIPMLLADLIKATAAYWGRHAGHALAEPLRVIRQQKFSPDPEPSRRR